MSELDLSKHRDECIDFIQKEVLEVFKKNGLTTDEAQPVMNALFQVKQFKVIKRGPKNKNNGKAPKPDPAQTEIETPPKPQSKTQSKGRVLKGTNLSDEQVTLPAKQ